MLLPQGKMRLLMSGVVGTENYSRTTNKQKKNREGRRSFTLLKSGVVQSCRNIVSTVDLGCKLDLKKIALHARNAEYNPKVWPSPSLPPVTPSSHMWLIY